MDKFATNPISQTYRKMEHTRPWGLICKYMNRQHIRRYPHTRNYHSRSQSCRSKARWLRKRARFETFRCIGERFQAGGWEGGGRRRPLYTTKPSVVAWGRGRRVRFPEDSSDEIRSCAKAKRLQKEFLITQGGALPFGGEDCRHFRWRVVPRCVVYISHGMIE